VIFAADRYAPHATEGRRLLAHELTHVVQQQKGSSAASVRPLQVQPFPVRRQDNDRADDFRGQAGGATERPGLIPVGEAATKLERAQDRRTANTLARGTVRFRVPTTADLKALFTTGNVPEDVLKDRIRLALARMAGEKHLKTKESVDDLMKKIFPAPKVFDEAAFEAAVDVTDRSRVYESVLDTNAKVKSADKPKLTTVMQDAAKLIDDCIADDADLTSVFGSKKDVAKDIYVKAKAALLALIPKIDTNVTTDYNLDDPETFLGGWAEFSSQTTHFMASVTKVSDEAGAKIVIIHESSHLADSTVDDKGYYGSPGFEGKLEDVKVTNAAHFEEIPRRKLGKSKYTDPTGKFLDFKPGSSAGGGAQTFEDKVREKAVEFFRKAWDKAQDVNELIRNIRKDELAGDTTSFDSNKARILELSKLMHLTVHTQPAATASINQVDVVLSEGVPRAMGQMQKLAKTQPIYNPFALKVPPLKLGFQPAQPSLMNQQLHVKPIPGLGPDTLGGLAALPNEDQAASRLIDDTILSFGTLTGDFADDKALATWLEQEYKLPL
jgi:hypothetical protein